MEAQSILESEIYNNKLIIYEKYFLDCSSNFLISNYICADCFRKKAMTEKITTVEGQKTAYEYTALANDFDKIATKDSNNWLPYYYAAFATIQKGRLLMQSRKTVELYAVVADEEK